MGDETTNGLLSKDKDNKREDGNNKESNRK